MSLAQARAKAEEARELVKAGIHPAQQRILDRLKAMQPLTGHRAHVFPHRDKLAEPMTTATLRSAINALGWGGKYSPHATRTTGSTQLNGMGYAADWIERQLAHADKDNVRATYNHASYLEERRRMMQAWADYLDELKAGGAVVVGKFGAAK